MAKASDVLRELETIGVLGNVVATPPRDRPKIDRDTELKAPAVRSIRQIEIDTLFSSFQEQLENLEVALRSMLDWCHEARAHLSEEDELEKDAPDQEEEMEDAPAASDEDDEEEVEEGESNEEKVMDEVPKNGSKVPAVETKTSDVEAAVPKKSLDSIRAQFFAPDALTVSERNGNGEVSQDVAEKIARINEAEEEESNE